MPSKITMYQEGEDDVPTPAEGARTIFLGTDDAFKAKDSDGVTHPLEAVASTTIPLPLGTASVGSELGFARGDHRHAHGNQVGSSLHQSASQSSAGFMSAGDKTNLDLLIANWATIEVTNTTTTLTTTQGTLLVDASGAAVTVTLPAASGANHKVYNIKKTDATANTVTIEGDSAETIDGTTVVTLLTQYENLTIQCDGTEWWIL